MKKKIVTTVALLLALIMITGCQSSNHGLMSSSSQPSVSPMIENTQPETTGNGPPIVDPTSTSETEPDVQPLQSNPTEAESPSSNGAAIVYSASGGIWVLLEADTSGLEIGCLYYLDFETNKFHFVTSDPAIDFASNETHVFFVLQSEPTKIYSAPLEDLSQHTVLYESDFGAINFFFPSVESFRNVFQIVEGNKRMVILDIQTMETTVVMEQYYIEKASIELHPRAESWRDYDNIYFVGKLNADDNLTEYLYNARTREIILWPYL